MPVSTMAMLKLSSVQGLGIHSVGTLYICLSSMKELRTIHKNGRKARKQMTTNSV